MRVLAGLLAAGAALASVGLPAQEQQRRLYVALPGPDVPADRSVRILVFDIGRAHRFVKRIALWPAARGDETESVKGAAAHAPTSRFYVSTTTRLAAIDLGTDAIVWQNGYDGHCCDRIALAPDGRTIYAAAFGRAKWYVVRADTGALVTTLETMGWPRDTIYSRDGTRAFLAAWDSNVLTVVDATKHEAVRTVGPFSASLCPVAINARDTLVFANVDGLVGFEVGDLTTGLILDRVAAPDYDKDAAAAFECPSHGIAFTPDGRELWVADGVRNRLHVFDARDYPPAPVASIQLAAQPRWIAFSADGAYAYSSTGDVIDAKSRKTAGALEDPSGGRVSSESFVEVDRR